MKLCGCIRAQCCHICQPHPAEQPLALFALTAPRPEDVWDPPSNAPVPAEQPPRLPPALTTLVISNKAGRPSSLCCPAAVDSKGLPGSCSFAEAAHSLLRSCHPPCRRLWPLEQLLRGDQRTLSLMPYRIQASPADLSRRHSCRHLGFKGLSSAVVFLQGLTPPVCKARLSCV